MCCHSNQHKCCLTPLSSLTWGSENGMCTGVSGSETTAASSTPSEREQHVFSQKHCIRHTPLSTSFCSLSLFSSPAFISHWPVVTHTPTSAYDTAYIAPGVWASGSELLLWSKNTKHIWGFGLKRRNKATLALPWSVVVCVPGWYPWVDDGSLQASSLN